jgi:hypothetical protein
MRALAKRVNVENKSRLQRARQRDTVPVVAVQPYPHTQGDAHAQNKHLAVTVGGLVFEHSPRGIAVSKPTPRAAKQPQPQTAHDTQTPPIVTPQTVSAHPAVARAKWGPVVPPRGAGSATVPGSYAQEARKPAKAGRRAEHQVRPTSIPKPAVVKPVQAITPELEDELRAHEEARMMIADLKKNMRL